jgi:hypothetical protein
VLSLVAVFLITATSILKCVVNDYLLIDHLIRSTQAQYIAEGGIAQALATLDSLGFLAKDTADNFPATSLGSGTFDVTVTQNNGRVLLNSVGQVNNISRTVAAEVGDLSPQSIYYSMAAGNELKAIAGVALITLDGNIHANNAVRLKTTIAHLTVSGTATAYTDYVYATVFKGLLLSYRIDINGVTYSPPGGTPIFSYYTYTFGDNLPSEAAFKGPIVTFPTPAKLDYEYYKQLAIDGGSYYAGDTTFTNETLTPTEGIIYVDGNVIFQGNCTLNGGIISRDKLTVKHRLSGGVFTRGVLRQHPTAHRRNMVISRTNNIEIGVTLGTLGADFRIDNALVYAANDFRVCELLSVVDIHGVFLASGNIDMWGIITRVDYAYSPISLDRDHNNVWTKVVGWTS